MKQDMSLTLFTIHSALHWDIIPFGSTLAEAKAGLKRAMIFLEARIEEAALADNTTMEKMLKQMKHHKAQMKCFNKLSYNVMKAAGFMMADMKRRKAMIMHKVIYSQSV